MRYWYCKDMSDDSVWLYWGSIKPVQDEDGDWTGSDDEKHPYDWLSEEDIIDQYGENVMGMFPNIDPGEIVEMKITFTVEVME